MSDTRAKRRGHDEHEEHEEHVNHEAWVIPYADLLTLLFALFMVLWALGDPNAEKTGIAAESFRRELGGRGGISAFDIGMGTGGGPLANGGVSVLEGAGPAPMAGTDDPNANAAATSDNPRDQALGSGVNGGMPPQPIHPDDPHFDPLDGTITGAVGEGDSGLGDDEESADDSTVVMRPVDPLDEIEQAVRDEAVGSGLSTALGFRREERGLVVSIVADSVLFDEGDAAIEPDGQVILGVIADALNGTDNAIIIEGHTDSRPISTARYPSNWELSTARATSVLRYLIDDLGFEAGRLSAAGYADTDPIATGDDPASLARNRRVEVVVIG